ncbi:MAG TPA: molecular chaperone TorD family protein [Terriglobales bacterium]|jgi:DMSO reductase family type II enzyme chaperone|nr:molecular chaperone TorD family protein [Terriglobales bacterium]
METLKLDGTEAISTGSRSRAYALLACGFRFPSEADFQKIKDGQFASEAQESLAHLPYNGIQGGALGRGLAAGYEEFQSSYIGLFEVGGESGSPSPLYEGEYGGGRMKVMEEVLRFYHYFGLQICEAKRDRPDHLASELEFMHLLTFKETEGLLASIDRSAYRQAQRDFLRFHLTDFVSAVASKVGARGAPFYSELALLAHAFCSKDLAYLAS